jgi:hypothetical protein
MSEYQIKRLGGSLSGELDWRYVPGHIEGKADTKFNGLLFKRSSGSVSERYPIKVANEFAVADQAVGIKVFGAAGWGSLGALVAGPIGAVVGGLLGGRGETVTFVAKFGEATLLGQVPKKVWLKMLADRY